jgi:hypothetical protein
MATAHIIGLMEGSIMDPGKTMTCMALEYIYADGVRFDGEYVDDIK